MSIIIDCHVHLYPAYDEGILFEAALNNLASIAPGAQRVLLLVERSDCDRFATLRNGQALPPGFEHAAVDEISVRISQKHTGESLVVVAGRQIATAERLEVLSWCCEAKIPDGLSLQETISEVQRAGGTPALAWAPGKWLGGRGALIRAALADQTCRPLMLCDTTLRPVGWPTPPEFLEAARQGLPVMAGTDPLPMQGEECEVGRFGMLLESGSDGASGLTLRTLLAQVQSQPVACGRRNGPIRWLHRYGSFMTRTR